MAFLFPNRRRPGMPGGPGLQPPLSPEERARKKETEWGYPEEAAEGRILHGARKHRERMTVLGGRELAPERPTGGPRAPGLFTRGGKTYGEEDIGKPQGKWAELSEEEVSRRRSVHKKEAARAKPSAKEMAKRLAAYRERERNRKATARAGKKSVLRRPRRRRRVLG